MSATEIKPSNGRPNEGHSKPAMPSNGDQTPHPSGSSTPRSGNAQPASNPVSKPVFPRR
jgi:hypothetical protein